MRLTLTFLPVGLSVLAFSVYAVAAPPVVLDVYGEAYPPFLSERDGGLGGPYADAFASLARQQGITVQYKAMPVKRLLQVVERQPNSCGLAVNFAPGEAETLRYVGRIAPITLTVFARKGGAARINNIEDLRKHRIGAIDIAEVRDLLDTANIRYEPLAMANRGVAMLQAKRFDLLISDARPELVTSYADGVERVFTLAQVERWVACNPAIAPGIVAKLRKALAEGVFAGSVRGEWLRYDMGPYFDQVRRDWDAIPRQPAKTSR
ncbi:hypothetical protein [Chitinimonas naiadis]